MKIKLYKTLSDFCEEIEVKENEPLFQSLEINFENVVIICNGVFVDKNYKPKTNDIILVRYKPFGSKVIENVAIGLSVAFPILLPITLPIIAGVKMYDKMKELQNLTSNLQSLSSTSNNDNVENLPFIKGSSNSLATGKTQPYIMGCNLFTPYILNSGGSSKGFTTIGGVDGEDSFFNVVLEGGFSDQVIKKIYVDDIILKSFSETTPQNGQYSFDSDIFASSDSYVQIAQSKELDTAIFKNKIVEQNYNTKLEYEELTYEDPNDCKENIYTPQYEYFTLENNSYSADLTFLLNGLLKYNKEGKKEARGVYVHIYYTFNYKSSSPTWHYFGGFSWTKNKLKQMRFNISLNFNYADIINLDEPIVIRIYNENKEIPSSEGKAIDDIYVESVKSYIFDKQKSISNGYFVPSKNVETREAKLSTLLAFKIKSSEANQDKLNSIQIVTSGIAKTWNKNSKKWSSSKSPTSNPASWLLEVLTSDCHKPSKIDESEIDLETFGELYEYCDENNIEFNYIITNGITKSSILEMITTVSHSVLYQNIYGKIAVAIDCKKQNAIALINEQNVISFKTEKDMSRKPDGVKVTFIDKENEYQQNSLIVMYDKSNPENRSTDSIIKAITIDGVTTYEQAYRHCLYIMRCANLRPHSIKAQVGKEAIFYKPMEKVLVQHPSLKIGLGSAEIKKIIYGDVNGVIKITGFELYEVLDLDTENTFNIVVNVVNSEISTTRSYEIKGVNGRKNEIYLKTPISQSEEIKPCVHNILSYGYGVETVTKPYLISGIATSEKGYTLELVNYDERIFNKDESIPIYKTELTQPRKPANSLPSLPSATYDDLDEIVKNNIASIDIQDLNFAESPNIYLESTAGGFSVDDDGLTPIAQKLKTTVHIIQDNTEIDFKFGEFNLPEGYTAEINYHSVIFHVKENVRVEPSTLLIPIVYKKYLHHFIYGDEEEIEYTDENGEAYGFFEFAQEETKYTLGYTIQGVKGGKYLGSISNIEDIPTQNVVIGDYFVWGGDNTDNYKKAGVYTYNGEKWIKDNSSVHAINSITETLQIANDDLLQNNSKAYEYLQHLTANSIFVDKLVANTTFVDKLVANTAFINNLTSNTAFIDNLVSNNSFITNLTSNTAFIDKIFTKNITLKDNGLIKSSTTDNTKGFSLKSNGDAIFSLGKFTNGICAKNVSSNGFSDVGLLAVYGINGYGANMTKVNLGLFYTYISVNGGIPMINHLTIWADSRLSITRSGNFSLNFISSYFATISCKLLNISENITIE